MVIARLGGGLGNQMDQYAVGRCLAYKLNTEFKLMFARAGDLPEDSKLHCNYRLGDFNIQEVFATPEEIEHVKKTGTIPTSAEELKNVKGNVLIKGHWLHSTRLYRSIADIIKKEFTLKKPFNPNAEIWHKKILSAECSVSMHFRHGDYSYNPTRKGLLWAPILPLDYYYTCIDILKQRYSNLTVFVFSDNLPWVKENLHLDVPTEFVQGCETDHEEFILMSLCKHNITASSTFSQRAAWLNSNPDKKIFAPSRSTAEGVQQFINSLTPAKKDALLNTQGHIRIPFDFENQPEITQRPIFSLLLVVNNEAANLSATLDSLLGQDYKFYEVIIIDNASTDGSDKICQNAVKDKKNVTLKRLESKVNNATAWNIAFKAAQGKYVSYLKVGDRFLNRSLTSLYGINEYRQTDIIHMFAWLEEDKNGDVTFDGKKFSAQRDSKFKEEKGKLVMSKDGSDATKLLLNHQINTFLGTNLLQINTFLGTKLYNYEFLTEHKIKFDESLSNEVTEIFFQIEAFLSSKYFMYIPKACYIPPVKA